MAGGRKLAALMLMGCLFIVIAAGSARGQNAPVSADLDKKVIRFLEEARGSWVDLNVPYKDGKILHDLVLKGNFRNILEIGTSTGHSTIWLAWAAAKTGGRVTTIEIDKERYETAVRNFNRAGVSQYIDARLGDAHEIVPFLPGPFDFVFCDADKEWYLQYFLSLKPKLSAGACYTAHNVLRNGGPEVRKFLGFVQKDPGFQTSVERGSGEGISVSCRPRR